MFRICISFHADPDPGGKSLCGSGSETLLSVQQKKIRITITDPDQPGLRSPIILLDPDPTIGLKSKLSSKRLQNSKNHWCEARRAGMLFLDFIVSFFQPILSELLLYYHIGTPFL